MSVYEELKSRSAEILKASASMQIRKAASTADKNRDCSLGGSLHCSSGACGSLNCA